jgi:lysophospholipase L1-like esterase
MTPKERLGRIDLELKADQKLRKRALPSAAPRKKYELLAEGDSWFDYPLGKDVLDCLDNIHGHSITKLARAGSLLNEMVYGPDEVLHSDPGQAKTRLTQVIEKLRKGKFDAFLFSGGGNDIAGPEFFSFLNHAASELGGLNAEVVKGVVHGTFRKAYEDLIEVLQLEAKNQKIELPIFIHGYDYPWPDGRGAIALGIIGPWFDDSFKKKGFPRKTREQLLKRKKILEAFIDAVNEMQDKLTKKFKGVYKVNLKGALPTIKDWANELHPTNAGFEKVAAKFNEKLVEVLGNA